MSAFEYYENATYAMCYALLPLNRRGVMHGNKLTAEYTNIHRVSKKTVQTYFCQNFVKFRPIAKIFGT